jgi:hypothetical protein
MKTWGSGDIAPPLLTSTLDGVVSFTPRPLQSPGKSPPYRLDRRLDDVEKNTAMPGIEAGPSRLLAVAIPTELSQHFIPAVQSNLTSGVKLDQTSIRL